MLHRITLRFAMPAEDFDGDNLSNIDEVGFGTDPTLIDTDGDGIPDDIDILGLDPCDDFDCDGLTNLEEVLFGTDPTCPDSDGDGLPDNIEKDIADANLGDCLVAQTDIGPLDDFDGDCLTNITEVTRREV